MAAIQVLLKKATTKAKDALKGNDKLLLKGLDDTKLPHHVARRQAHKNIYSIYRSKIKKSNTEEPPCSNITRKLTKERNNDGLYVK